MRLSTVRDYYSMPRNVAPGHPQRKPLKPLKPKRRKKKKDRSGKMVWVDGSVQAEVPIQRGATWTTGLFVGPGKTTATTRRR